jgi:hypothetical protein
MRERNKGRVVMMPYEDLIDETQLGPTMGEVVVAIVSSGKFVSEGLTKINAKKAFKALKKIGFFKVPEPPEAPGL